MDGLCIRDLARIVRGHLTLGSMPPLGGDLEPIGSVVADLPSVSPGTVFWEFTSRTRPLAEEAFARGAQGVVVSGRHVEPWAGRFSIDVDNPRHALWRLARDARQRFPGRVVGVAGQSCRRESLQMLQAVLRQSLCGRTIPMLDADPNHFQQVLSVAQLDAHSDYLALEFGGATLAEIREQSDLCDPTILVINSLANSRPENESQRHVAEETVDSILEALPADGWAVLNVDDPLLRRAASRRLDRVLSIGRSPDADLVASRVAWRNGQLSFVVENTCVRVPVWGRHYLSAALAAFAVGRLLEMSPAQIAAGFETLLDMEAQYEIVRTNDYAVVYDSSTKSTNTPWDALRLLRDMDVPGRRVVAYGDDGSHELGYYRRFGTSAVAECGADLLIVSGPQAPLVIAAARAAGMPPGRALACESTEELSQIIRNVIENGDVVLLQGKPGSALQPVMEQLHGERKRLAA